MKKRLSGIVVSDKMKRTVVVKVESIKKHPKYLKRFAMHKKYKAHDEKEECRIGDIVIIEECRPMSRDKKWRVIEKLKIVKNTIEEPASLRSQNLVCLPSASHHPATKSARGQRDKGKEDKKIMKAKTTSGKGHKT